MFWTIFQNEYILNISGIKFVKPIDENVIFTLNKWGSLNKVRVSDISKSFHNLIDSVHLGKIYKYYYTFKIQKAGEETYVLTHIITTLFISFNLTFLFNI